MSDGEMELLVKMILTSQRNKAQKSICSLTLLKIEHLICFKTRLYSLSNQHSTHLQSISAPTLLTTCFNSMLKSLTLFLILLLFVSPVPSSLI